MKKVVFTVLLISFLFPLIMSGAEIMDTIPPKAFELMQKDAKLWFQMDVSPDDYYKLVSTGADTYEVMALSEGKIIWLQYNQEGKLLYIKTGIDARLTEKLPTEPAERICSFLNTLAKENLYTLNDININYSSMNSLYTATVINKIPSLSEANYFAIVCSADNNAILDIGLLY